MFKRAALDTFTNHLKIKITSWLFFSGFTFGVYIAANKLSPMHQLVDINAEINLLILGAISGTLVLLTHFLFNLFAAPMHIDHELRNGLDVANKEIHYLNSACKEAYQKIETIKAPRFACVGAECDQNDDQTKRIIIKIQNTGMECLMNCKARLVSFRDKNNAEIIGEIDVPLVNRAQTNDPRRIRYQDYFNLQPQEKEQICVCLFAGGSIFITCADVSIRNRPVAQRGERLWFDVSFYAMRGHPLESTFLYWKDDHQEAFWDMGRRLSLEETQKFASFDPFRILEAVRGPITH